MVERGASWVIHRLYGGDGGSRDVQPDKYNSVTGIELKVTALYHTQREKYILQK